MIVVARFVGGILDGQHRWIDGLVKFYEVPIPKQVGSIEDLLYVEVDEDGIPVARRGEYSTQRYQRTGRDPDGTRVFTLEDAE